ncbi:uncharacterized protein LOC111861522 isoform X2 [Cryptotermes secundus]|nr:uncharacterized protein LOC111861522 isoform X2 [Cryptotermes secundus]
MQSAQPRLTISNVAFREHLREHHCMWLPVYLPAHNEPVPIDVAVWLFELRHYSDSNEVPCNSSVNLDYDSVADSSCELHTEESQKLNLKKSDEIKQNCHSEVKEHPSNAENSTPKEDIPGLLIYEEAYVKIHSKEEAQIRHCDIQEYSENSSLGEDIPGLVIQKKEVSVESPGKTEESLICHWCPENSATREDIPGLLIQKEEVCAENLRKGEDILNCHCECSENSTSREDITGLQQTQGDSIQSHKCDRAGAGSDGDDVSFKICSGIVLGNGIVHTDEDNQEVYQHEVGESPSCNHALKYNSILWEANPLYCGVGLEGNGRVIRKLCHNALEHPGSSIHVDSVEESGWGSCETSEPVVTSFIECGVDCILKTCCSVCGCGTFSSEFPLNVCSNCCSLGEETCQCRTDRNADTHLIDSCVGETAFSVTDIKKVNAEIYGWDVTQNVSGIHDDLLTGISNTGSDCDKAVNCHPTSEYFGDGDEELAPCGEKYEEVLHHLELTIQNLLVATGDISGDHEMEPDADFLKLCQEAQDLAEETSQQCSAQINSKRNKARSITLSSDLSDEVFINSPSSDNVTHALLQEVHRRYTSDINSIFDDGTKPPVPPARMKRNKERSKTLHVTEQKVVDETKVSDTASDNCLESPNHSNDTELSVEKGNNENSLLDCQELLIMKRVTESTKEKRNVRVASHYEDRNLYSHACHAHQCVPDCDSTDVAVVSGGSHPPLDGKNSESFVPDDVVIRKPDECGEYLNIVLTRTRPISSTEFPPSEQQIDSVSSACEDRLPSESVSAETMCDKSGILLQTRKGSTSSDIAAWKQELQNSGLFYLDDEWDADCMLQPDKWFSSNDSEGRVYFFEENSNVSSWTLPDFGNAGCDNPTHPLHPNLSESGEEAKKEAKDDQYVGTDVQLRSGQQECQPESRVQHRMVKAHSMVLADASRKKQTSSKSSSVPRNWPQLWDGNMCVLKEGTLNRTKITENGKKLRKNWAPAHVVLTELFLLFFKDAKTFETMKISHGESASGAAQPEFSIDLNGALLEHGEKASSRRNVFLVTTVLGLQVLLQCENAQQEEEWYKAIHKAIKDLPSAYDASPRNKAAKLNPQHLSSSSPEETKKSSYIGRSRSVKLKVTSKDGSQEDLTASSEESQTKIRNRLKKFFHRRPTKEILVKKGIYKDEPVFGCHLADVCRGESPRVPAFVQHCVAAIECKEENMKTDGLYRASGNLSQVQKIRLQVDQNNLEVLEQEEDVHVLTGALKLFFRELKKPLIPFDHFSKALKASTNPNKKEKLQQFKEIVKALPLPNRDTLEFLLRHLLRVTEYKEFNRMHIPNLAIVFGPTLMWPEAESSNMALDLMQQNLVIECFLQEFYSIFQ